MSNRLGIVPGIVLGWLALGAVAALPTRAEWLVTRDGRRVETKGPWQVKGKLVVFTRAENGSLSSLRTTEVDLEASANVTADAKLPAQAPSPREAPKKKLAVLTDANFHKPTPPPGPAAERPDDKPADKKAPASGGPVVVSSWKRSDRDDGLVIEGTLHNTIGIVVGNASVQVRLYNEAGDRVGEAEGLLASPSLEPGGSVAFQASFPGIFAFADAKFQARGMPLNLAPPPDEADQKPVEKPPPS